MKLDSWGRFKQVCIRQARGRGDTETKADMLLRCTDTGIPPIVAQITYQLNDNLNRHLSRFGPAPVSRIKESFEEQISSLELFLFTAFYFIFLFPFFPPS